MDGLALIVMYLKIKKAELVPTKFGSNDIKITMIGLYNDDGSWVKWVKLNPELIKVLLDGEFKYNG